MKCWDPESNLENKSIPELESVLLLWFKQVRDQNIAISGPILKAKAEDFAKRKKLESKAFPAVKAESRFKEV